MLSEAKNKMSRKFLKNIIFTRSQLTGTYRYRDEFQFYPLDLVNAPTFDKINEIPICFEFYYEDKDVKMYNPFGSEFFDAMVSETTAQMNKRNRILRLLSTITNYRFQLDSRTDIIWGLDASNISDEMKSIPIVQAYAYPNISQELKINDLTPKTNGGIIELPPKDYYTYDPIDNRTKQIKLPLSLNSIIDKYFKLDDKTRLIADAAMYQLCNALDCFKSMKSLSFVSAVSSIETMLKIEFKKEKLEFECKVCQTLKSSSRACHKCGRPKWGIAEKYREYLFKYVEESPESRKLYSKIYSIRSKIVHTEYLIFNENVLDWELSDKENELSIHHLTTIQLARVSFVNWLLKYETS